MSKYLRPVHATVTMFLVLSVLWCQAESRDELALRIDPEPFDSGWYSLFVFGQSATNFILETSSDLKAWHVLYQAFGWPGTNPVHRIGPSVASQPRQFLRALPGESLDVMEQRWLEKEPTEYTFRLLHEPCLCPGSYGGTVRVRNGAIVEVTDAVDDFTREPIPNPDFSKFLTISQLFEEIRREFDRRSEQIQVTIDPRGLFPAQVLIDRDIRSADEESTISATDFAVVAP